MARESKLSKKIKSEIERKKEKLDILRDEFKEAGEAMNKMENDIILLEHMLTGTEEE